LTDAELWATAPTHAYALTGFVAFDIASATFMRYAGKRYLTTVGAAGTIKFVLTLGDILTAPEFGLTYFEFAAYLLNLWPYDIFLISQLLIAIATYYYIKKTVG